MKELALIEFSPYTSFECVNALHANAWLISTMIFCYKNATSIISIIGHDWNGFRTFLTYYTHIPGTQITSNVAKALDMLLLPLNSWPRNLAQYIIITMIICFNTFKIFNIIFFIGCTCIKLRNREAKL